jgi:hypothetical protein
VLVGLALVIALAAAVVAVYHVSLSSPHLSKRQSSEAHGKTEILIDSARSPIAGSKRDLTGLIARAGVFARLMSGGDVVAKIAKDAGLSSTQIDVAGPTPLPGEAPGISEAAETRPYGLAFNEVPELPIVSIATRAPGVAEAQALAAAAPEALRNLITTVQKTQSTPPTERVEVRVLGPAEAQMVDEGPGAKIGLAVFVVLLALEIGLILGVPRLVAAWKRDDETEEVELLQAPDIGAAPGTALVIPNGNGNGTGTGNGKGKDSHSDRPNRVRQRQR